MRLLRFGSPALLLVLCVAPALSQSAEPSEEPSAPASSQAKTPLRNRRQPPCWKQAGIAANLVNERWKLEDQGKARIAMVCTESSSAQQKRTKIQLINQETEQAVANLIPPKQLQVFNACQSEYEKTHPKPASEKELGPCGGVIPDSTADDHMGH